MGTPGVPIKDIRRAPIVRQRSPACDRNEAAPAGAGADARRGLDKSEFREARNLFSYDQMVDDAYVEKTERIAQPGRDPLVRLGG